MRYNFLCRRLIERFNFNITDFIFYKSMRSHTFDAYDFAYHFNRTRFDPSTSFDVYRHGSAGIAAKSIDSGEAEGRLDRLIAVSNAKPAPEDA